MRRALLATLALLAPAAEAADLAAIADFEGAVETHFEQRDLDSHRLPIGPFSETEQPIRALEGLVTERVIRIDGALTSLEALREVEARLHALGYVRLFDCDTETCGGFDFRFNTHVIDAPDMEVDLADFRYLSAERIGADTEDHVGALVSLVGAKLYLQLVSVETQIKPRALAPIDLSALLLQRLEQTGRSILDEVNFVSGSSELSEGSDPMLAALSAVMFRAPELSIAIVGHTDNVGDADLNQQLSEARAAAVVARLVERFEVPADRFSAHGVGFLAPATSNATEEGRRTNRRVVAVVK